MRLLPANEYRRMPWKNGGGETLEVAIGPTGAPLDRFDWRVSLAKVAVDGPFSRFPGIDRTLSIVQGSGLRLVVGARHPITLTAGSAPFAFPGDAAAEATLIDGPVTDLNVMTRRGAFRHRVERLVIDGEVELASRSDVTLLLPIDGALRIDGEASVGEVAAFDTLLLSTPWRSIAVGSRLQVQLFRIDIDGQ
jgi:environmental stress-induced protein Ves